MQSHYEIVDGLRLPAKISGHPALDFCNTWVGWDGRDTSDYLVGYEHLALWAGFVGLLPAERIAALRDRAALEPSAAGLVLERARVLRTALYGVLVSGAEAPGFDVVDRTAADAAGQLRLAGSGAGFARALADDAGLDAPLLAAAWSASELLVSRELSLVRACPGTGCGWLFLDQRGRRRWCVMSTCGNRAKARRFAQRQRDAGE